MGNGQPLRGGRKKRWGAVSLELRCGNPHNFSVMLSHTKIAVLTSGGIDSAILLFRLLKTFKSVYPIYVRSGHQWERAELYWLRRFLKSIETPRLKPLVCLSLATGDLYRHHWSQTGRKIPRASSPDRDVYLPGKNILLITKTSVYCALQDIPNLALGPLQTNPFPDAKASFFKAIGRAVSQGLNFQISIHTPFLRRSKKSVMRLGRTLPLELTFSCLSPKRLTHCGACNKCAERKRAFRSAGLKDQTRYAR